jgi:hypothetical protein
MNCQTYRQHCTLDPNCHEPDFLSHQQACSSCAAFTEDLLRFEQTLVEAIKVEIPDGLTERILHKQSQSNKPGLLVKITGLFKRFWLRQTSPASYLHLRPIYALAVSMLLVIGLFAGLWWWQADTIFLKRGIITYVENTPQAFQTGGEVPSAELRGMFKAIGAKLTGDIGQVSFCNLLTLQGHNSAHIVLTGTKGPINVLFIRDSKMTGPQNLSNGELKGLILSTAWGNLAIIGIPQEPLEQVAERINEGVSWL